MVSGSSMRQTQVALKLGMLTGSGVGMAAFVRPAL